MELSFSKESVRVIKKKTPKHRSDFYCLNCLCYVATENKCKFHKKVCQHKDFCNVVVPSKVTKILEFNQNRKADKAPFIIYTDFECSIEIFVGCKNNPENSSTTKLGKHILSGFSMSTISSFKSIENNYDVYIIKTA